LVESDSETFDLDAVTHKPTQKTSGLPNQICCHIKWWYAIEKKSKKMIFTRN